MNRRKRDAFTLLEVIVAVGILGISLTAIFASESGALRTSARANHYHVATLLARCKMGEIEEQILREGFPAVDDSESDECCEGAEVEGYTCDWSIQPIVLPVNTSLAGNQNGEGSPSLRQTATGEDPASRALGQVGTAGDFLAGGGNRGGLEDLMMQLAVPALMPAIEAQVRRVNVNVHWNEGEHRYGFDVSQFLVNEAIPNVEAQQSQQQRLLQQQGQTAPPPTGAIR